MIFFTGFLVGVVSLVPGISGGTILVLLRKYEQVTKAITNFKKKENIILLSFLVLGIFLGTITFARIIELFFYFWPQETLILFSGFVLFNIPSFIKSEKIKLHPFWFFLGFLVIYCLSFVNTNPNTVILNYPSITFSFLLFFSFCGAIDGFFTILPGISGSMIMMILGPYFLYKSFLANLNGQNILFFLPLFFYFLGDSIGFFFGSKVSLYYLKKHRKAFLNFVLGMVFMSAFILLPAFHLENFIQYILPLSISFLLCKILNAFN